METVDYKGFEIKIEQDECPTNPRTDWDNGTVMICRHKRYDLGDKDSLDDSECSNWGDVKALIEKEMKPLAILPLYLYDHSGITMNTTGFSCGWDSGQVGFIIVTEESANVVGWTKEYVQTLIDGEDEKYAGKTYEEILENWMRSDVEVYDHYITGSVYRFEVEGCDDADCGGFFGYDHEESGLLDHARSSIDAEINWRKEQRFKKLKEYIRAGVPSIYRVLPSL